MERSIKGKGIVLTIGGSFAIVVNIASTSLSALLLIAGIMLLNKKEQAHDVQ
jgi:hypothetical protein